MLLVNTQTATYPIVCAFCVLNTLVKTNVSEYRRIYK